MAAGAVGRAVRRRARPSRSRSAAERSLEAPSGPSTGLIVGDDRRDRSSRLSARRRVARRCSRRSQRPPSPEPGGSTVAGGGRARTGDEQSSLVSRRRRRRRGAGDAPGSHRPEHRDAGECERVARMRSDPEYSRVEDDGAAATDGSSSSAASWSACGPSAAWTRSRDVADVAAGRWRSSPSDREAGSGRRGSTGSGRRTVATAATR